jgi:hypothetical protein
LADRLARIEAILLATAEAQRSTAEAQRSTAEAQRGNAEAMKGLIEAQTLTQKSLTGLNEAISRYVDSSDLRMKRLEENLDGLIRAITSEHRNGKTKPS